jgi:hypothetical protein
MMIRHNMVIIENLIAEEKTMVESNEKDDVGNDNNTLEEEDENILQIIQTIILHLPRVCNYFHHSS